MDAVHAGSAYFKQTADELRVLSVPLVSYHGNTCKTWCDRGEKGSQPSFLVYGCAQEQNRVPAVLSLLLCLKVS